ncbi:hypothetical protein JCM8202_004435 [Rhodotorula sphaerocarpa]
MAPTSPPTVSSSSSQQQQQHPARPPARNKSSSALSSQTLRSSSSTSQGKPRRNKSAASLVGQLHTAHGHGHGHGAGHHHVSFQHQRKPNQPGSHGLKRVGSASGSSRKPTFGLGMTTMGDSESPPEGMEEDESGGGGREEEGRRPRPSKRRTSSSSTATAVSRPSQERRASSGHRSRSRSNSTAAGAAADAAKSTDKRVSTPERPQQRRPPAETPGSIASSSGDWESTTDSPAPTGRKLPDTAEEEQPPKKEEQPPAAEEHPPGEEEPSELAKALDGQGQQDNENGATKQEQPQQPARTSGKKAKFQLGASDPFEDEEEEGEEPVPDQRVASAGGPQDPEMPPQAQEGQVEGTMGEEVEDVVPQAPEGSIPPAAMPPAATAILPSLPATIEAVAPDTPDDEDAKLSPKDEQEAAAVAAPPPTSAAQHLSPPELPPDENLSQKKNKNSLLAAAQPELAFPNKPPSNPPSQNSTRPASPVPDPATPPEGPTQPLSPNPTSVQRQREEDERPKSDSPLKRDTKSQAGGKPTVKASLPRQPPARKASDASIMSTMSRRSYFDRPAPQFRRSASGVAPPSIDRDATARGDFSGPASDEGRQVERTRSDHARGDSTATVRSPETLASSLPHSLGKDSLAPGHAQRSRSSDSGRGALAALGSIAAAAGRPALTPTPEPGLSVAKRSASGYFNALRGFTTLPSASSTPPLSPSAGTAQSQRSSTPGAASSSLPRNTSARPRASPTLRQPPLVVKFVEPPQPKLPAPGGGAASQGGEGRSSSASADQRSTSPAALRGNLSAQHRNSSTASLGPMSRTQQKALLARDAPQYNAGESGGALVPPTAPGNLTPAQQQFLVLQQQRAAAAAASASGSANASPAAGSSSASPAPGAAAQGVNQGMQKWAFGLVREAERIERQYRAVEKWRDPLGESLERVLIVRQRARRRREDDREKVRQAIAAAAAAKQQQQGGAGTTDSPTSRRSSAGGGTSENDSRPSSNRGKQRSEFRI